MSIEFVKYLYIWMFLSEVRRRTIHFYFAEVIVGILGIFIWIWRICSVDVEDNVSTVCDTHYVCRIWCCGHGKISIQKTQRSIIFVGWVWYVDRISQESFGIRMLFIWDMTNLVIGTKFPLKWQFVPFLSNFMILSIIWRQNAFSDISNSYMIFRFFIHWIFKYLCIYMGFFFRYMIEFFLICIYFLVVSENLCDNDNDKLFFFQYIYCTCIY